MIRLLMLLHPRAWRSEYGDEVQELAQSRPVTACLVLDLLVNAARQNRRARPVAVPVAAAVLASIPLEIVAVRLGLTQNILWFPATVAQAVALAALLLIWLPVAVAVGARVRSRRGIRSRRHRSASRH